jgi:hypothetical protein
MVAVPASDPDDQGLGVAQHQIQPFKVTAQIVLDAFSGPWQPSISDFQ